MDDRDNRDNRPGRNTTRIAAVVLLIAGCVYVLMPFLAAILFAAAVVISSWPLYLRLQRALGGHRNIAALTMTLSLTLLVIIPLALVAWSLANNAADAFDTLRASLGQGELAPPAWIRAIPLIGDQLDNYLRQLVASRENMLDLGRRMVDPARHFLVAGGLMLGNGVAQMALAAFVSFFFYRDGESLRKVIAAAAKRVIGEDAQAVTDIVANTVRGVMYGLLGTALAQGLVAAIGFAIAGVPAVVLLSVFVFARTRSRRA